VPLFIGENIGSTTFLASDGKMDEVVEAFGSFVSCSAGATTSSEVVLVKSS
jgi:hypothetical protein